MWASDFFANGIIPDCTATSILELQAAPAQGAVYANTTIAGVTIK
jgi:hypothetical protein